MLLLNVVDFEACHAQTNIFLVDYLTYTRSYGSSWVDIDRVDEPVDFSLLEL